jgi:thiol:disulfide interchange protein DsbA
MLLNRLLPLVFTFLIIGCSEQQGDSIEVDGELYIGGIDYQVLEKRLPFDYPLITNVVEIFWYGCPHCEDFEPALQQWLDNDAPEAANFTRSPAIWAEPMVLHAKAYYMAKHWNLLEKIHSQLFTRIIRLRASDDLIEHKQGIADLFLQHGVSPADFEQLLNDEAINKQLQFSLELMQQAQVKSTPSFVVSGKYVFTAGNFKSKQKMLKVVGAIVERELTNQTKPFWNN